MIEQLELIPQNTIRIETALSRFPVHKLARQRGGILIDIRETTSAGELKTKWKVSYNSEYGQPGPLAYRVDTLIINRRIDDERPSIPKIIKLGSLSEICRELGVPPSGANTNDVKRALHQNASAYITAKISYKATNGGEGTIEAGFSRYSVIFTGESFPDGRKANAVYLILNDVYMKVLNEAQTRPLDYDYLRDLPPAAQRFYELVGFQIYAVLKHERPRARLLYSDFCARAPQTRYPDYDHVKKQMYKVHAPHLRSGYLSKVEFQEQRGESGELDWLMFYTPGRRAQAEFREASKRPRSMQRPTTPRPPELQPTSRPEPTPAAPNEAASGVEALVSQLRAFGVSETKARELTTTHRAATEEQLAAYPYRGAGEGKKNAAGWIIAAIENNYELPPAYIEARKREAEIARSQTKRAAIAACALCNESGQRIVIDERHPRGAVRKCSHDPEIERQYSTA